MAAAGEAQFPRVPDDVDRMLDLKPERSDDGGACRFIALNHSARSAASPRTLARLLELKLVVCEQLVEIKKTYALKHIFDPNHWSIAAISPVGKIVGGLTFRPFPRCGFVELVFLAVRSTTQRSGVGASLMAQFKQWCRAREYYHIVTCADNGAVNFFAKQGYSAEVVLNPKLHEPYMEKYVGITVMECLISPLIRDYTQVPALVASQRRALYRRYRDELARVHRAAAAATPPSDAATPTPASSAAPAVLPTVPAIFLSPLSAGGGVGAAGAFDRLRGDEVLRQMGWTPPTPAAVDELRRTFAPVVAAVMAREEAAPFRRALSTEGGGFYAPPEYFAAIRVPMDFGTIAERLERGEYLTQQQVLADLARVGANSLAWGKSFEANVVVCRGVLAELLAPLGLALPTTLVARTDGARG